MGRSVDEVLRLVQAFQYTDEHGEGKHIYVHLCSYVGRPSALRQTLPACPVRCEGPSSEPCLQDLSSLEGGTPQYDSGGWEVTDLSKVSEKSCTRLSWNNISRIRDLLMCRTQPDPRPSMSSGSVTEGEAVLKGSKRGVAG